MKKVLFMLAILMMFCFTAAAGVATHPVSWQELPKPNYGRVYLNTTDIEYDKKNNVAAYWTKSVSDNANNGNFVLSKHIIDFQTKMAKTICIADIKGGKLVSKNNPNLGFFEISPESDKEAAANVIAKMYGLKPIYNMGLDRWVWLMSTERETSYLCTDPLKFDRNANICVAYIKNRLKDGYVRMDYRRFDFNNGSSGAAGPGGESPAMYIFSADSWPGQAYAGVYKYCMSHK